MGQSWEEGKSSEVGMCTAGCAGPGAGVGQGQLHLPAHQLVPAGQGQVQGAHLCPPGAGPAQGLLGGAGQGRLRPGHQPQALEGLPPTRPLCLYSLSLMLHTLHSAVLPT